VVEGHLIPRRKHRVYDSILGFAIEDKPISSDGFTLCTACFDEVLAWQVFEVTDNLKASEFELRKTELEKR
jgi:hypothetical protein